MKEYSPFELSILLTRVPEQPRLKRRFASGRLLAQLQLEDISRVTHRKRKLWSSDETADLSNF